MSLRIGLDEQVITFIHYAHLHPVTVGVSASKNHLKQLKKFFLKDEYYL